VSEPTRERGYVANRDEQTVRERERRRMYKNKAGQIMEKSRRARCKRENRRRRADK
jgi:hypothetical protein